MQKKRAAGHRRYFEPQDLATFRELRGKHLKQQDLKTFGVSEGAISRLEQGGRCWRSTAVKIHEAFKKDGYPGSLEDLFKVSTARRRLDFFDWDDFEVGAKDVGEKIFNRAGFYPDAVLTFTGPSQIFAGLVMQLTLPPDDVLTMPTFTGMFTEKKPTREAALGFRTFKYKNAFVLIPSALGADRKQNQKRKLVILDDSITTGIPIQILREHLPKLGYQPDNIKAACCVWYEGDDFTRTNVMPETKPNEWAFKTDTNKYELPWGPNKYLSRRAVK